MTIEASSSRSEIERLVTVGKAGDGSAETKLRAIADHGDPALRGVALASLGRLALSRGDMETAETLLKAGLQADRTEGRLSDEMRDGSALIWGLVVLRQRLVDARLVLASLLPASDRFPEGKVWYATASALVAAETDDLRDALAGYRDAMHAAERLNMTSLARYSTEDLARILVIVGRFEEAASLLEGLPSWEDPCAQASLMINRGEALAGAFAHHNRVDERRVVAGIEDEQRATSACRDPHRRLVALADAARFALRADRPGAADALVARLREERESKDALAQAWRADILGRWALAQGHFAEALADFVEQASIARAAALRDETLRAEVGAARALLALRRRPEAIRRLRAAEALMERALDGIPLGEGRGEYLGSHDEAVLYLVDALVEGGDPEEAMTVARSVRTLEIDRVAKRDRLRTLSVQQRNEWDQALERYARIRHAIEVEATNDWTVPASLLTRARADREIRAEEARNALDVAYRLLTDRTPTTLHGASAHPRPGEVEIAFFPGTRGWIVFARTSTGVAARRFPDDALESTETASAVLGMMAPDLKGARHVLFLPFGRADRLDWHATSWMGTALVNSVDVAYSLDLPDAPKQAPGAALSPSALLVTNPTGDLAVADAEGDFVAGALGGWRLTRFNRPAATRDNVLERLPHVDLFHYAGHTTPSGPTGSLSALLLADGGRVELGDLLALQRLPEVVVLSACRAAATPQDSSNDESRSMIGLAQAFLAAGTRAVVAPTRDVADTDARAFMVDFYAALGARDVSGLSQAFRVAAGKAIGTSAQSFRLVTR